MNRSSKLLMGTAALIVLSAAVMLWVNATLTSTDSQAVATTAG